jgi:KaiC/GvpD/RAD55 family RecA-like ATPase
MSYDAGPGYRFPEWLPIEPIPAGSTVLVAGPAFSKVEELTEAMVGTGTSVGEGALFISTNRTSAKLLKSCRRTAPDLDRSRLGIIDCSGQDIGRSIPDAQVKYVSTQSDLTGIGMKFSALYESLYGAVEGGRVRTGLISLSSLSMYVDLRKLFQFAQTLSGRIDSAGGLAAFTIDPATHDEQTVNTLSQVADARMDVREPEGDADADGELQIRGLDDQPAGWQPFTLPSA